MDVQHHHRRWNGRCRRHASASDSATTVDVPLAQITVGHGVTTIRAQDFVTNRSWTGSTEWTSYTPSMVVLSGLAPLLSGTDWRASYRVLEGVAVVKFRGSIGLTGGGSISPDYGVSLPILPRYAEENGAGTAQNTSGNIRTNLTGTTGCVQLLRCDHANLDGSHPYYDSFDISYEIAG
jgi:hypothetical protein